MTIISFEAPRQRQAVELAEYWLVLCAVMMIGPFMAMNPIHEFFFDDFYYYLVIVDNYLNTGEASFFPGVVTNGVQPLWFWLMIGLRWLTGQSDPVFFAVLTLLILGLSIVTIRLLRHVCAHHAGTGLASASALILSGGIALSISLYGMEIVLAIPLLLALYLRLVNFPIAEQQARDLVLTGLLAATTVLARIDSVLIIAAMTAVPVLRSPRALPFLVLGGLPLAAYLAWNLTVHGVPLPISGAAKQLREPGLPSLRTMASLLAILETGWTGLIALVVTPLLALQRIDAVSRGALVGGTLQLAVVSVLSDWPLWFWYLYPLVLSLAVGASSWLADRNRAVGVASLAFSVVLSISIVMPVAKFGPGYRHAVVAFSDVVTDIATRHDGVFAIGDFGGAATFHSGLKVVQTEGLVMDREFLDRVARRDDLFSVLSDYGVDYLISHDVHRAGACWFTHSPARAGPHSPRLEGLICRDPVEVHDFTGPHKIYLFDIRGMTASDRPDA